MDRVDDIIIELITLFNDITLIALLIVNKKLYNAIMLYFKKKLRSLYEKCLLDDDNINNTDFIMHYLKRIKLGIIYNKDDKEIKCLKYDFCHYCKKFGKMLRYTEKKCENNCVIECCNINNIIHFNGDTKLKCGHITTLLHGGDGIANKYCSCGSLSSGIFEICDNCEKIQLEKWHDYQFSSNSEEYSSENSGDDEMSDHKQNRLKQSYDDNCHYYNKSHCDVKYCRKHGKYDIKYDNIWINRNSLNTKDSSSVEDSL